MSVTLQSIMDYLYVYNAPPVDGLDHTQEYLYNWNKALSDFNRKLTRRTHSLLSIVSGQDTYALPYDFSKIITIDLETQTGAIQSEGGISQPTNYGFAETYTISGGNIKFIPTPTKNVIKNLWYGAGHYLSPYENIVTWQASTAYELDDVIILDSFTYAICTTAGTSGTTEPTCVDPGETISDGTVIWTVYSRAYEAMTDADMYIIAIKAKSNGIRNISVGQSLGGIRYQIGELTIDRTRSGSASERAADMLDKEYKEEIKDRIGHYLAISYRQSEETRTVY